MCGNSKKILKSVPNIAVEVYDAKQIKLTFLGLGNQYIEYKVDER